MRIRRSLCAMLVATSILAGCTSYRGANRLHETRDVRSVRTADSFAVRMIFRRDLEDLIQPRAGLDGTGGTLARTGAEGTDQAQMKRLLNSGFSLVRLYCNEYFNEMGRNQRNSAVLRDLVKPLTDIVNLVIGLKLITDKENVNADLVTGFAGLSSAATAGLDVYDRHFLFDNDNIAAVRTMTMNALAKHREEVYKKVPDDVVLAIGQLQDNENICTPSQILSNVREAIKKGEFTARSTGGSQGTTPPAPQPPVVNNREAPPDGSEAVSVAPQS